MKTPKTTRCNLTCAGARIEGANRLLLRLLRAGILSFAIHLPAQTFTTLYSFTALQNNTNSDGATPLAGLVSSGNTLYGAADFGGPAGFGTIFSVNADGSSFTTLYSFTVFPNGVLPYKGVILSSNALYGAAGGGPADNGTLFAVNTDGTDFRNLHSFSFEGRSGVLDTNADGRDPNELILSGSILYGSATRGGTGGRGTIFRVNTDGTGFSTLHSFSSNASGGAAPEAGLVLSGSTLYGTANDGGSGGQGTIFKVGIDGSGFTTVHNFTGIGTDGGFPRAPLIVFGKTFYGTTEGGGTFGNGTIFKLNIDGTGFKTLHSFSAQQFGGTNTDGLFPGSALVLSGNALYGMARGGGTWGLGTVFTLNTNGTGFTTLYSFSGGSDGRDPHSSLAVSGNTLYGTTDSGGDSEDGTIFSISLPTPPRLTITRLRGNVVLTWPTNATGFTLQSTTNPVSPALWSTNSSAPTILNGQNTVTNSMTGPQQFYRLTR